MGRIALTLILGIAMIVTTVMPAASQTPAPKPLSATPTSMRIESTALTFIVVMAMPLAVQGQQSKQISFDVATIKPTNPDSAPDITRCKEPISLLR